MSERVSVTISGPIGSGKSAIYGEIVLAMQAIGVPVEHSDPKAWQSELNMAGADFVHWLELYKPTVVMSEVNIPREPKP